jgi:DNA-binding transcriptional ArsR family regulator
MDALAALADPTRRQIVDLLRVGDRPAGDIAARFPVTRPAVSRHLRVLREAGLAESRVEGQQRIYRLRPEALRELDRWLEGYRHFWATSLDSLERHLDEQGDDDADHA